MLKNRLKELRARDGYNQTTLAKKINVSRQTISLIERGDYAPSVTIALALANLFEVAVEDIFQLEGEGNNEE
ncbi:helix-turn-helix transcriptional regulator [Halalkalibacter okhensis]|uniref:XRE family transcriptional regulator n=1 Tax=Halalkalibacter okhensis TaxID=333138 RepID=A0A0B0IGC1_9BACI|nr:helix-turn-helix transcriptional regulator [Halalkalibacter okhensis]KHF41653.1 XRE family transcriptional regulator [Halalkalibacter okhensis]